MSFGFGKKKGNTPDSSAPKEKGGILNSLSNLGNVSIGKPKPKVQAASTSKVLTGLDIGSRRIKIAVGRVVKEGKIQIKSLDSYHMLERASYDGKILKMENVKTGVKNILNENRGAPREVTGIFDSTEVIRRELIVPIVSDAEAKQMISYEIAQYLPIDPSAYAIQFKKIAEVTDQYGKQMKVMVCAIPQKQAKEYHEMLEDINVKPVALDVTTNAMEKMLQLESRFSPHILDRNIVFVDLGHSVFNVSFYKGGTYMYSKIFETGGFLLDDIIRSALGVGVLEAERIKIHNLTKISILDIYKAYGDVTSKGMATAGNPEESILKETLATVLTWTKELDAIMKYYTSRGAENTIDEVILYGGGSYIRDIDKLLELKLQTRTKRFDGFSCIELDPSVDTRELAIYLEAIGAIARM